ncbi:MAG: alpha/beta fold hydrolase, partial [Azoarcus sp.]|nr:alpha/beta fold hydrolase [Azoarcus sp.]
DKDGDPVFPSVKSPECFQPNALGVLPPRDVLPVIFVPGIAGSNLQLKGGEEVWVPPNGASDIGKVWDMTKRSLRERQELFDPENTEVHSNGECSIDDQTYWLNEDEARRRGWGSVHALSYNAFLQRLEVSLNDQYILPGRAGKDGNRRMLVFGLLQYLAGGPEPRKPDNRTRRGWVDDPGLKYAYHAKKTMKVWGQRPRALTPEEMGRLDDYYYPVWAYGYNWLGDPEEAAKGLVERIESVLKDYERGRYFRHQGKVILVTHSMGGLIARRAAQMDGSKILGVVHGVCPLVGAAVLYRRLRSGQEGGGVAAAIMGNTQAEMTVQLGRSPGAFTLAPTKDYPMNWLRVYATDQEEDPIFSLPKTDPYTEVYAETDAWWRMVEPDLLDPKQVMTSYNKSPTPVEAYKTAIGMAEDFHDRLGLHAHPETYGFYGSDDKEYRSFGHVSWLNVSRKSHAPGGVMNAEYNTPERRKVFATQKGSHHQNGEAVVNVPDTISRPENRWAPIHFRLSEERNQAGDGTVPICSGEMLRKLTPPLQEVLGIPGYDHQAAFNNQYAYRATIYFIARIVQKAAPPPKGTSSCSAPTS